MPIDPKWMKAILVTIFIVFGGIVGYQLVTDSDTQEAEDTFADMRDDSEQYSDDEVEQFEASLGADVLNEAGTIESNLVFNNSFEHTKPGEYSEIIVDTSGLEPGEFTIVYVRKAGTQEYTEGGGQQFTIGPDGKIDTRFFITEYGDYEVTFSYKGEEVVSPIITVQ